MAGPSLPNAAPRTNAAAVNDGGRLLVIGGLPLVAGGGSNTPAQYMDPNNGVWREGAPAEGQIVNPGAGIDDLGRIVVFGGVDALDPNGG
ncbi:MAG: hypothetical protein D6744_03275, partial [Planctomycetota bacterium]